MSFGISARCSGFAGSLGLLDSCITLLVSSVKAWSWVSTHIDAHTHKAASRVKAGIRTCTCGLSCSPVPAPSTAHRLLCRRSFCSRLPQYDLVWRCVVNYEKKQATQQGHRTVNSPRQRTHCLALLNHKVVQVLHHFMHLSDFLCNLQRIQSQARCQTCPRPRQLQASATYLQCSGFPLASNVQCNGNF